jgi:coenzyme F420-reducing hydrogenase delta subunit
MTEPVQVALIAGAVAVFGSFVTQIPAILVAFKSLREVTALKIHVNSNTEKLIQKTKELATRLGVEEGRTQAESTAAHKADAVAVEVARAVEVAKEK